MPVTTQSAVTAREFSGVVDAERKVDLAFRVSGTLASLPVLEGSEVAEGDLLAALDKTDFEIQLRAVTADFNRARAEYERASALVGESLISRSDYDRLQAQYYVAEAELEKARQELEYTELHAPFAGLVARQYVDNLTEVSARSPILTLVDLRSLVVRIEVPESVMIRVRREGIRPELYAVFDAAGTQQYPLSIREVVTQPEPGTQTYPVTLALPRIDNLNILPGMSARVGVRAFAVPGSPADTTYLPSHAVLEDADGRYVFVAVPEGGDEAVIERREVTVSGISAFGIEVSSGLADGDEVVTAGMSQLRSGLRVLLMDAGAGAPP